MIFAPVLMVAEVSIDLIQPKLMAQIVDQGVLGIGNGGVSDISLVVTVGIRMVTAWCAAENSGSRRVLEKAGMKLVRTEKDGLTVGEKTYDKLIFAYHGEEGN